MLCPAVTKLAVQSYSHAVTSLPYGSLATGFSTLMIFLVVDLYYVLHGHPCFWRGSRSEDRPCFLTLESSKLIL